MPVRRLESLAEIPRASWNGLALGGNPFLEWTYLEGLERSGAACADTGWRPCHLVLEEAGQLQAALPLYLKDHSWGEFVFDFAWADAYHRAGVPYYPKLVSAIPFTPVPGARVLVMPGADSDEIGAQLIDAARELAQQEGASSLHLLLPEDGQLPLLRQAGMSLRQDCQFHWFDEGYGDFEGFLGALTAQKRKKFRRERRRVLEQGIRFDWLSGADIDDALFHDLYRFYATSFLRRGMEPYFPPGFWQAIFTDMPASVRVVVARLGARVVAAAIFFVGGGVLYGRYWGCDEDYHSLHFETCFYQGIELALAEGCRRFEPGAQGEHKLRRGFRPVPTWSAHWLANPAFARAIEAWLAREREHAGAYIEAARLHLPFRRDAPG
ncbi:MAG TPA: GNAT family N-acetyltransferase [Gammaproteobacteria bacterium]|nr:GNAT family N-acetyltransferase [Gammaproteobacteria bacterium]